MSQQTFAVSDEVHVKGRAGVWVICEMVQEGDGITTAHPFWLLPKDRLDGMIRAKLEDLSYAD